MRFVFTRQAGSVELLFMFADQCLDVNTCLFINFLKCQSDSCVAVNEGTESISISVLKKNKSLMGLERHEGE